MCFACAVISQFDLTKYFADFIPCEIVRYYRKFSAKEGMSIQRRLSSFVLHAS